MIHLVDIACFTESQKLAHLIYLEQLTWIPINAGEAPEDSMTHMIGVSRDVVLDPDKTVHIMHITVGTSAVHLVGKKSAMEFDMFTMSLYEEDMGQPSWLHPHPRGRRGSTRHLPAKLGEPLRREHRTKEGGMYSLEDICSV